MNNQNIITYLLGGGPCNRDVILEIGSCVYGIPRDEMNGTIGTMLREGAIVSTRIPSRAHASVAGIALV